MHNIAAYAEIREYDVDDVIIAAGTEQEEGIFVIRRGKCDVVSPFSRFLNTFLRKLSMLFFILMIIEILLLCFFFFSLSSLFVVEGT